MTTHVPPPHEDSPVSRRTARLRAARRAVARALDETLDDLAELMEEHTDAAAGGTRLIVFRTRPAGDAYALHRIDVGFAGQVAALDPQGAELASWTELYGDLREAVSRFAAATCPEGLVVLLRGHPASIAAFRPEHCGHWDGVPELAIDYPPPLPDAPPITLPHPRCCAEHRIEAALERCDLAPPSTRTQSECDQE